MLIQIFFPTKILEKKYSALSENNLHEHKPISSLTLYIYYFNKYLLLHRCCVLCISKINVAFLLQFRCGE